MKGNEFGRNWSWSNCGTILEFYWWYLAKPQTNSYVPWYSCQELGTGSSQMKEYRITYRLLLVGWYPKLERRLLGNTAVWVRTTYMQPCLFRIPSHCLNFLGLLQQGVILQTRSFFKLVTESTLFSFLYVLFPCLSPLLTTHVKLPYVFPLFFSEIVTESHIPVFDMFTRQHKQHKLHFSLLSSLKSSLRQIT